MKSRHGVADYEDKNRHGVAGYGATTPVGEGAMSRIDTIVQRLHEKYPDATYELRWETPFQLLIATILAAQATDKRVNIVTTTLFEKYPNPQAFVDANREELERELIPTGYYRQKARAVQEVSQQLLDRFGGEVPKRMEDLITLRGVARKTANVVLNCAFNIPSGIIVDTHVQRASRRMGLTTEKKPEKIERDLMGQVPEKEWTFFGPALVLHGRYVCSWANPKCERCIFKDLCERIGVGAEEEPGEQEE
jgi:endonuclease-3